MSRDGQDDASDSTPNSREDALELVNRIIAAWRNGQPPDALAFLDEHPHIRQQKSLVLDLAYEEYCLRKERGESVSASDFAEKFPEWNRSLSRLIDVHEYLDQHPEFAPVQKEPKWPQAGESFSGFDIDRKVGSGAFARVYVARDPTLGYRPVVLKVSRSGGSEAMTLGRLTHDNIVPVNSVKVDEASGLTVICMPYQGEATLVDLLEAGFKSGQQPRSGEVILSVARHRAVAAVEKVDSSTAERLRRRSYVDAVVELGIRLTGALKYAHSRGVLHRDLKPSNVLLSPAGDPKLLDFNLSWDTQLSGARLGGTVPYMSPEQVQAVLLGKAKDGRGSIDQRSDLFSLGVLLYELLTGTLPFGSFNFARAEQVEAQELLKRQQAGARPAHELNPDVDPSLSALVSGCLEFDPADRPQTGADLEASLLDYQRPLSSWKRRINRRRWWAIGALVVVTILAIALAHWAINRPPYSVRAYRAGLASYQQGDWDSAIQRWTDAMDADRATPQLLFARGTAYIQSAKYLLAIDDLQRARQMSESSSSGPIIANLAYCYTQTGKHGLSRSLTDLLVNVPNEERKLRNAAVFNNRGYHFLLLDEPATAIKELSRAIEIEPDMAMAYQNRARAKLALSTTDGSMLQAAAEDIETALKLEPRNWGIQRDAIQIFAEYSYTDVRYRRRMTDCLQKVEQLGGDLADIPDPKGFDRLRRDADFSQLLNSPLRRTTPEPARTQLPFPDVQLP